MKILVTGATSGLGRNLTESLHRQQYEVIATGRNEEVGKVLKHQGIQFIAADLRDAEAVKNLCKNIDVVYHCAALSSPWGPYKDFYEANVVASKNLVKESTNQGISLFVHVSTPSIYFDFNERFNIKEDAPLPKRFANNYALTKWMAEQVVDKAFNETGLPTITIRPRAIFGPHDRTLMTRLIRLAKSGKVPLIRGGRVLMDVTSVNNVVDSLVKCLTADRSCWGKKYNITNGEPLLLTDLLDKLFAALEIPYHPIPLPYRATYLLATITEILARLPFTKFEPPLTCYGVGVITFGQTLDITAANQELGYSPKVSIAQGIQLYADWLRRNYDDLSDL